MNGPDRYMELDPKLVWTTFIYHKKVFILHGTGTELATCCARGSDTRLLSEWGREIDNVDGK